MRGKSIPTIKTEEIFLAGGCLWEVQEFIRHLNGVVQTEAGRANGRTSSLNGPYDGYAECVKTNFDPKLINVGQLVAYLSEIIDYKPYSKQASDLDHKYRSGVYSENLKHLEAAKKYIQDRADKSNYKIEVCILSNYLRSDEEHQDRLTRRPEDKCYLPKALLHKYKKT